MSVVHLSVHSHYSLLNGLPKIPDIVGQASVYGMEAIALTDRNNLYGAIEFYKTCHKKNIKPIIGVDLDCELDGGRIHLIFLAENTAGYHTLVKLVSAAQLEEKGNPHATEEHLTRYGKNLIVLVPESALQSGGTKLATTLTDIFGTDNVFARIGWNGSREAVRESVQRARTADLPLVAGDGAYYLKEEDRDARDIVRRIADPSAERDGNDRTFISPHQFEERYREFPDALQNASDIAKRVHINLSLGSCVFPNFSIPHGAT